ncbi:lysylphosphatidylglycerol synthase transmembrane domain-containing protein [Longispora albida]|uniref:lysylphosphatidylglycerol synthase transmembrane domain-containing protein n=1 Tax=Longispora albida TaxID=203523 RepID=UPI001FE1DAF1|nr:lysylphosphatidylglycerol synthase transmembrane domain-containing protein [Longispora albida]
MTTTPGSPGEAVPAEAAEAKSGSKLKRWATLAVRYLIILAIAGFLVTSVMNNWSDVEHTWKQLAWQSIAASLVMAIAAMFVNTLAWRAALKDVEHDISVPAAAQICLVGGMAKYLPGSVWAYLLQMELGKRAGLPRPRAFLASLLATGLGLTTALVLGLAGVPTMLQEARDGAADYAGAVQVSLWIMAGLLPIALLCAVPAVLTRLVQLFLKLVKRPPLESPLTWAGVLRVVGYSALGWTFFGLHLWFLINAQAAPGITGILVCIAAFAIAMNVGMFAIISPSGLGVREGVLVAALVPFLSDKPGAVGAALGIALASRLILTIADVVTAGASWVTAFKLGATRTR